MTLSTLMKDAVDAGVNPKEKPGAKAAKNAKNAKKCLGDILRAFGAGITLASQT
jgi:hypothetical protein